jgi:septal ring factor EnvC (AmiA/AmiB activator)
MKRAFLIFSIFISFTYISLAQDISEQTKRREALEKEIKFLDKQLSNTTTQHKNSTKELELIKKQISNRKTLILQITNEINRIDKNIKEKQREVNSLKSHLESLKKNYEHLIYNSYKYRDKTIWILYILASKDFEQGYRRWNYLKRFSISLKESAIVIKEKSLILENQIVTLNLLKEESLKMKEGREAEYRSLAAEEKRARDIVQKLSRRERQFRKQITEKRREVEKLNREIERLIAQAAKAQQKDDYKNREIDIVLSGKFENNRGKLPWPVRQGVIIEKFGQHNHPVFPNIKLPFNNGINISTTLNAPVMAIFDGEVKQVLVMPGYNQCILIQHGNYYTFYTKMETIYVKSGDIVKTGETIGVLTESEGNSILHFQLWQGTTKQNPEIWLSK